jgi:3-phosphoshikimate 1-carboxyvinyltransferase
MNTDKHRFYIDFSYLCASVSICGLFSYFLFVLFGDISWFHPFFAARTSLRLTRMLPRPMRKRPRQRARVFARGANGFAPDAQASARPRERLRTGRERFRASREDTRAGREDIRAGTRKRSRDVRKRSRRARKRSHHARRGLSDTRGGIYNRKQLMKIKPARRLKGKITLPGDKSISHRAALLSAMAEGETRIENFATSADCASTVSCLQNLGVEIRRENSTVFVKGVGKTGFRKPENALDCGNSGTTMRLIAGILAGQDFDSVLTGDESLSKRPMRRIIEPLELMGAEIDSNNGCAPLKIYGKNPLRPIEYDLPVASAQVKSCLLLAGLNASGTTKVKNPKAGTRVSTSRNHTELMLSYLGAQIEETFAASEDGFVQEISIDGSSRLIAKDLQIPSDISSAAFFIVAAACLDESEIVIKNVGLNPTRTAILEVLRSLGARIEIFNERESCREIIGDLRVSGSAHLQSENERNIIEGEIIANLIDEIPILAIFGTQVQGGLEIRNAAELRVKESDRIAAVVENLRRMNAQVEEFPDGFRVEQSDLRGARIDSFGDHRIAMSFAVAALFAEGETEITGAESAGVSFPEFFEVLSKVVKF